MGAIALVALAAAGYLTAEELGGEPHAVDQPAAPPPPGTPDTDIERQRRPRPKHGRGRTILAGDLEPTDVKKKKLLGAEPRVLG
jgi:hypothetical protein